MRRSSAGGSFEAGFYRFVADGGGGRMTGRRKRVDVKPGRPTIGLLIGRVGDIGFSATIWPGVAELAEERDVNLICFVGGMLNLQLEFDLERNVVYDLVGPQNVDGLVGMSGSVGQFAGPGPIRQLYERFHPLPVISVGMELKDFPSVLVDNSLGMRRAVAHLIEVHGFERIAFIRGPETSPEAVERYNAYCDVLAEHGLAVDPDLVVEGNFLSIAGREGVITLLDRRKERFQAIAAANDSMALSALAALQERGIHVPDEVSVVGFDDLEETRYVVPPMTTVRQPFHELGRKATELLLDRLAGKPLPDKVVLPTELIVRRSCGCSPSVVESAVVEDVQSAGGGARRSPAARKKRLLSQIESLMEGAASGLPSGWAENLVNALTDKTRRGKGGDRFITEWENLLRCVGAEGVDVMRWHRVLDVLQRDAPTLRRRGAKPAGGPDWRVAELLIGEIAQWAQANRRFQAGWHSLDFLIRTDEPLLTAFDIDGLTDAVEQQLPDLGVRSCYFSLYDFPEDERDRTAPSEWARLVLACTPGGRVALEAGGRRFPSRDLVPKDILSREERFALVLESLHFRDENHFGFILFGPLHSEARQLREVLARQIGTALKGAMLLQEQSRAEEQLRVDEQRGRVFQERLRTLLEVSNDLSLAESVDDLCRRAVELGRSRFGFDRLGIWFRGSEPGSILGSFGTDVAGKIEDMRGIRETAEGPHKEILRQTRPIALFHPDTDLGDAQGNIVGRGDLAQAAMWNGTEVIGFISLDNLLSHRPISGRDCELLNLYASTLGYLCSRKQAEEALKDYSGHLEEMVVERTRELQQAQENLVRQEKLAVLGQLAATVSHELRNPLATLRVSATDLDRKVRSRGLGAERPLDRIQRNISRCDNIISELLDYARMPEPDLQPVDFDEWLNRLLDEQTLPPGITLRRNIVSGATLAIDPERFRRVIINLVDNARQAMQGDASEGAERILTIGTEVDSDSVTVTVSDTGPGIPQEMKDRLFEPLVSTKGFGVGLGLSIVKGIVEQHGGEIRIISRAGEGTQATIRLPRIPKEENRA
jgi:DNA-binding LacI/PurR family transcriptional regulator/signal transduction histidine kinase